MDVSARLTSKGQVTIPRSVREALGLLGRGPPPDPGGPVPP